MAKQLSSFQPKGNPLMTGLVSYWKLDESSGNASDSIGSNTGTNNSVTYTTGKINNGASFNGSSSYLSFGTTSTLNPLNISISCWFNSSSIATAQTIISRDTTASIGLDRCYSIYIYSSKLICELFSSSTVASITGSTTLSSNTWYFVTITYDGVNVKMYLNGVSDATPISTSISLFTASVNTEIGKRASSQYFNGLVDEVGFWNRALTATEVGILYAGGLGKQLNSLPNSTKLYMPLNGNSIDISGSQNHGTDTAISYVGGMFGQGARMTTSSIITNNYKTFPSTGDFTCAIWLKPESIAVNYGVFGGAVSGGIPQWSINGYNSSNLIYLGHFDGSTDKNLIFNTIFKYNIWYSIFLVRNGDTVSVYVNGILDNTSTGWSARDFRTTAGGLIIGQARTGTAMPSTVDEFIAEERAWTATEISSYYRKSMLNYRERSASIFSNFISYLLTADVRSYVLTGISNNIIKALRMLADIRTYTLTGIDALFSRGKGIVADVATFVLTGRDAVLSKVINMIASVGTFTLTGIAITYKIGHILLSEVGSFILSGKNAILKFRGWTKTPKDSSEGWTKTPKD